MLYEKKIEKIIKVDTAVIGGGTAGVFAAIAAARCGADTVLIEKNAILGGTMTVGGVNFPGLFFAWGERIIGGPAWESIERTVALGGAVIPEISYKTEPHWKEQILLNKFIYTAVLFDMCREAGVRVICSSMLTDAIETEGGITLICSDKSGIYAIETASAIDATADANLTSILGYEAVEGDTLQPATLQNHISGYSLTEVDFDALAKEIEENRKDFSVPDYITSERVIYFLRKGVLEIHTPVKSADTSEGKTEVDAHAHALALATLRLIRSLSGFENTVVDYSAGETGIRETKRIVGEHTVTREEYLSAADYPDSISYAFYPLDKHVLRGIEKVYLEDGRVPKVPYRALIPKGARRLLAVGRCISADADAMTALRVEAACMGAAQGAGCAAALMSRLNKDALDLPFEEIKRSLENIGAIVPK